MTTMTAQSRRQRLAEAHAKWFASTKLTIPQLQDILIAQGAINAGESIAKIQTETTTIEIRLNTGEFLELDAYGNILRGEAD